jgi:long-chain fatty acid transport protein
VGATYHTKTAMSDLTADGASVSFNANMDDNLLGGTWNGSTVGTAAGTYSAATIPVSGKISVKNFQWPETYGFGMALQANDDLLLVADFKRIGWKNVMKDFKMTFTADATQANPMAAGFAGTVLDATMYQNWDDQNVIELGAAYKASTEMTLRAGVNLANNPVPDKFMNPLFPAIAKNHATAGFGYAFSKSSVFDMSFVYVPKVSATNGSGVTVDFAGYSTQLAYSYMY